MDSPAPAPRGRTHDRPTVDQLQGHVGALSARFAALASSSHAPTAQRFAVAADHCRDAYASLAASRPPTTEHPRADLTPALAESDDDLASELRSGLRMALNVIDNDDEELTPFEVLAITCTVTSLCSSLSGLQGTAR